MDDQPFDLSEYTKTIGYLVVTASSFDYEVGGLLAECFCLSAVQENVLLRPLGIRAKVEIVQRLAKFIECPNQKEISKWCENVKGRFDERNTVVHGVPGLRNGKPMLRLYSAAKALGSDSEEWPLTRVADLALKIGNLEKELETLIRPAFATWIQASAVYSADYAAQVLAAQA